MARKFLTSIDMSGLEILNALAQNLASPPAHAPGRFYYDTTQGKLGISTGSAWVYVGESGALDAEAVQDIIGAMVDGNTETGLTVTYDDATGKLNFALGAHTHTKSDITDFSHTHASSDVTDLAATVKAYRLDEFAVPTTDVSLNNHKITNLATPTAAGDAATKAYVDALSQGLDVKASVRVASTADLAALSGLLTVDGVTLVANDRVLVKNQTSKAQNGIYLAASGAWTRSSDADAAGELSGGTFVFVEEGTTQADTGWVITTNGSITPGTTAHDWSQFSGAGAVTAGDGLTQTGTTINVVAGTGVSVAADSVGIDTAVVVRKAAASLGDGSTTSFVVTHNLNTRDVTVAIYLNSGTYEEVEADVEHTSVNTVTVRFATAPAASAYRCVVHA